MHAVQGPAAKLVSESGHGWPDSDTSSRVPAVWRSPRGADCAAGKELAGCAICCGNFIRGYPAGPLPAPAVRAGAAVADSPHGLAATW